MLGSCRTQRGSSLTLGKMNRLGILIVLFTIALVGCAKSAEVYLVRFLSKSGDELASGTIAFEKALPTHGTMRGKYRLEMRQVARTQKEVDWFFRLFESRKQ